MIDPNEAGNRAELEVAATLSRAGYGVFVPLFGANGRIDLVAVDRAGAMLRVQCKTARVVDGAVVFRVCSNTRNVPKDYRGEIDRFGVYAPVLDAVFLVPVDVVATRACHLRLEPARNGQQRKVRWAEDYRVG